MATATPNLALTLYDDGATNWGAGVNANFTAIDTAVGTLQTEMNTAESDIDTAESDIDTAQSNIGTLQSEMDSAEGRLDTLEADPGTPVNDIPITIIIPGDNDYETHLHFHVQVDEAADFSDPIVDAESRTAQTNHYYFDGAAFVVMPVGGVLAYFTWEQDRWGQKERVRQGYAGRQYVYLVPNAVGLQRGTVYYGRVRSWDVEASEYGLWQGFCFVL